MKAFGWFFLFAVITFAAGLTRAGDGFSLACDSGTACFDIMTDGGNITHIFVDSTCAASASEYAITVDGEPVEELYTDDGPCERIPRDVWFPLQSNQDTAHVYVSVQGAGSEGIYVYAKVESECVAGAQPGVSIQLVE
jgi:hypothetical protein